jgi:hypothetical protein
LKLTYAFAATNGHENKGGALGDGVPYSVLPEVINGRDVIYSPVPQPEENSEGSLVVVIYCGPF